MNVVAERDPAHREAAEWFVRLQQRDLPLDASLDWQRWMSADPRHAEAFARIEEVWGESWDLLGETRQKPRRTMQYALSASLAAAVGAVLWLSLSDSPFGSGSGEVIRTAVGENREVQLSDGSRVTLGGGTELHVAMGIDERQLQLLRGEAFFTVAKDSSRAFVVKAGEATVTAVGTEFNVRLGSDRTVVAVVEGRVIVTPPSLPAPIAWVRSTPPQRLPVQLMAGQEATVGENGVKSTQRLATAAITSWQTGQLAFREEPLRYVLEDVNRYSQKPIVIENASGADAIGDIRITGTVLGDSVEGWIDSLEKAFRLTAVEESGRIVLRRTYP